jgi:hypothetical protein
VNRRFEVWPETYPTCRIKRKGEQGRIEKLWKIISRFFSSFIEKYILKSKSKSKSSLKSNLKSKSKSKSNLN